MRQTHEVTTCPACGFDGLFERPWTGDSASDEICPCCGIHFGYDDFGYRSEDFYAGWRARAGLPMASHGSRKADRPRSAGPQSSS